MLEHDGLCSHSPLSELPAGQRSLSAEELEAKAAELIQRRKEYMREWRGNEAFKEASKGAKTSEC